jgi:hypothetical protein
MPRTILHVSEVLAWADEHRKRTGKFPLRTSGIVKVKKDEKWLNINAALARGFRGFPGGWSLPQLLSDFRGYRHRMRLPRYTIKGILEWADAHKKRTGRWPKRSDGEIKGAPGESWNAVEEALVKGRRGLPGGTSLAQLLEKHRGVPNRSNLPKLSIKRILGWLDAHKAHTGRWPTARSPELIAEAPYESWQNIDAALMRGTRGLRGGSSLAQLLADFRKYRNIGRLPDLTVKTILQWVDAHKKRTGLWPRGHHEAIHGVPGETWRGVSNALRLGRRGLPGGSSLAKLLAQHRGVRHKLHLPKLSVERILHWVDAHKKRTGQWPMRTSGLIAENPSEKWITIDDALVKGSRGLPGGSTLARLLRKHRRVQRHFRRPSLSIKQILDWVDAYHKRTGTWPKKTSGLVAKGSKERWWGIHQALRQGKRGLEGRSSLAKLLAKHRGVRNIQDLPSLSERQIREWIEAYRRRHGRFPARDSGPIAGADGETWSGVVTALYKGLRGLPGDSTLSRLRRRASVSRRRTKIKRTSRR